MAISRGKRTSLVSGNISVNRTQSTGLGGALESFGETALKIGEQQAAVMDEIWKGDFKVKTAKFLNDLSIEQEAMDMPDLTSAQQQILGYKEELIKSSSTRYSKYIENYLDLKAIDTLDGLRKRSNAIMFNNVTGSINNQLDSIKVDAFNSINKILENPDILTSIDFRNEVEKKFNNLSLDINDINFDAAQSLDPLQYNDAYIKSKVDTTFLDLEKVRMYGLAMSFYKGVDFTNTEEVQLANQAVNEFRENYQKGNELRLSKSFGIDEVNSVLETFDNNVQQIIEKNEADIELGKRNIAFENQDEIQALKDTISQSSINNLKTLILTPRNVFKNSMMNYGLDTDTDLVSTLNQKYALIDALKVTDVDINKTSFYNNLLRENNITLFKNDEELKLFLENYKVAQIQLVDEGYSIERFSGEYRLPFNERSKATNDILDMIINENVVPSFIADSLKETSNIITSPKMAEENPDQIIRNMQLIEFILQGNPLAQSNLTEKGVDLSFYNMLDALSGESSVTSFLMANGVGDSVQFYQDNKKIVSDNMEEIMTNITNLIEDKHADDEIRSGFSNILVDYIVKDTSINKMWMDGWNSLQGNPDFQYSENIPMDSLVQFKKGILTPQGPDSDIIVKGFVGLSNNAAALIDKAIPGQPFLSANANVFFEFKPEVKQFLDSLIYTQLSNSMDMSLFKTDPDRAEKIVEEKLPVILQAAIGKMSDNNYSVSSLSSDTGNPVLMKHGIETTLVDNGYSGKDGSMYLASQVKVALVDYQRQKEAELGDNPERFEIVKKELMEDFPFLYNPKGDYREPSVEDIYDNLDFFQFKPVEGANRAEYLIMIRHPGSSFKGMPIQDGKESYTIEIDPVIKEIDANVPRTMDDIQYLLHSDIINNKSSFLNKTFGFTPKYIRRNLLDILGSGREITDEVLEPISEFITFGNYNWETLKEEYDRYIERQTPSYEEIPEVALQ
jgi:hypothetical protein